MCGLRQATVLSGPVFSAKEQIRGTKKTWGPQSSHRPCFSDQRDAQVLAQISWMPRRVQLSQQALGYSDLCPTVRFHPLCSMLDPPILHCLCHPSLQPCIQDWGQRVTCPLPSSSSSPPRGGLPRLAACHLPLPGWSWKTPLLNCHQCWA